MGGKMAVFVAAQVEALPSLDRKSIKLTFRNRQGAEIEVGVHLRDLQAALAAQGYGGSGSTSWSAAINPKAGK